ncbi:competence protein ComK [Sutcliffiella cohnii]|uniref:Competence protein ComK n=1 Tax=Sutcliffiella cohnii TaxID=33932 RepID=A0A223KMC9_9BACI|nr:MULTISPECIES: competence protein ComK [Sutcliffiella]AST90518.1 hypothetical protein BC6307_04115 [Sutcliffiella cohnii]MED4016799.1 competence protein ComK [Sutcliffiella cohnii]WBL16171.1 competence protein ComK [Sutcliffiella sp. NC1]
MKKEYLINQNTIAIVPEKVNKVWISRVIETDGEYLVEQHPKYIINQNCWYSGTSLQGSQESTKVITGITHKQPIVINLAEELFFFPTMSPRKMECMWICPDHIIDSKANEYGDTIAYLSNNKTLQIPMSLKSFKTQILRTSHLRFKLRQKQQLINVAERPFFFYTSSAQRIKKK